jgi:hypothetical protein
VTAPLETFFSRDPPELGNAETFFEPLECADREFGGGGKLVAEKFSQSSEFRPTDRASAPTPAVASRKKFPDIEIAVQNFCAD